MGMKTHSVIFAGVGGMGALTSGQLLARAAMKKFKNVTWYPNITTARRNAPADCLVCYSDTMIYSQLIKDVESAVVMNNIQLDTMKNRVKSGGLLIFEADDRSQSIEVKDIQVIEVPGIQISSKIANPRVINTVYLGVYIGATKAVPHEFVQTELEKRFEGKDEILKMNLEALNEGIKFGQAA